MRTALVILSLLASSALAQQSGRNCASEKPMMRPRHYDSAAMPWAMGDKRARLSAALKTSLVGWSLSGTGYELTCDEVSTNCGVILVRSQAWRRASSGAFLHSESALPWRGSRVELRAEVRTGAVDQQATLVITAQDAQGNALARVRSEPLKGTSSFSWRSVTLDVPAEAERLLVGFELVGRGALYLREVQFDNPELLTSR